MNKMDEQIVVVPRAKLFGENDEGIFHGFNDDSRAGILLYDQAIKGQTEIKRRGDMEIDPSYKQLIPYVVLRSENTPVGEPTTDANIQLYTYKRLTGGGEERLHDKLSIGIGGHMNSFTDYDTFTQEAIRELNEELEIETLLDDEDATSPSDANQFEYRFAGYINDESDEVGKVHLGVVLTADVDDRTVIEVRETEQLAGQWRTLEELRKPYTYERLENWSKLVVDSFA